MAEMYFKKMVVTPEIASVWLLTNPRNRSIKLIAKNKLVADIKNGAWEVTHQMIAISPEGKLIDGHHRLEAIVESGISCEMWVAFNAPESSKIDHSVPRTDQDSLYMANIIEKGSIEYFNLTYPAITYMVAVSNGANAAKSLTAADKHILYLKYQSLIDPIMSIVRKFKGNKTNSRGRSASVTYAMICALNAGVPQNTIYDWYYILATGDFYKEGDDYQTKVGRSVLVFRNYLEGTATNMNLTTKEEVFRKAQSSLYHFSHNHIVTKLYGMQTYPLVYEANKEEETK